MNPRVIKVNPLEDYKLELLFANGEEGIFDMKPWLNEKAFHLLRDKNLFGKAHISYGTVSWNDDIDVDPDTLYLDCKKLEQQ